MTHFRSRIVVAVLYWLTDCYGLWRSYSKLEKNCIKNRCIQRKEFFLNRPDGSLFLFSENSFQKLGRIKNHSDSEEATSWSNPQLTCNYFHYYPTYLPTYRYSQFELSASRFILLSSCVHACMRGWCIKNRSRNATCEVSHNIRSSFQKVRRIFAFFFNPADPRGIT